MPNTGAKAVVFGILHLAENLIQAKRVLLKNANLAEFAYAKLETSISTQAIPCQK